MAEWIRDASVVVSGTDPSGNPIEVKADVEDVRVERDMSMEEFENFYGRPNAFVTSDQYFLKMRPRQDGVQYTFTVHARTVERTAEIEVDGCTPAKIEQARIAVGAPEDAGVRMYGAGYWPEAVRVDIATQKTKLIFVWEEKVFLK